MAILKVHGGDFLEAESEYNAGFFRLKTQERKFYGETINVKKVKKVEIANETNIESLKKKPAGVLQEVHF